MKPSHNWGPSDGTQIRRGTNTVFVDVFPSLRIPVGILNVQRRSTFDESKDDFVKELEAFYGQAEAEKIYSGNRGSKAEGSFLGEGMSLEPRTRTIIGEKPDSRSTLAT